MEYTVKCDQLTLLEKNLQTRGLNKTKLSLMS